MSMDEKHESLSHGNEIKLPDKLPASEAETGLTPSWFSKTYPNEKTVDLALRYRTERDANPVLDMPKPEAYEAYRRNLEERFQSAKRLADARQPANVATHALLPVRPAVAPADTDGTRRYYDWERKVRGQPELPARPRRSSLLKITTLLATACVIGGLGGFATANRTLIEAFVTVASAEAQAMLAELFATPVQEAAQPHETVLTKKPIKIARIDVNDISGQLNWPIALDLAAFPADDATPLSLKITGLPGEAYLTKGTEIAEGQWLLKPADIRNAELVVPRSTQSELALEVSALEDKSGALAAPAKEMKVALDLGNVKVIPVSAAPEQAQVPPLQLPAAIPLPQDAIASDALGLVAKGEALLKSGDIIAARQFFLKAHELGTKEGAFGVGQTYDPAVYAALNVRGLKPDRDKAVEWYGKAATAGSEPAVAALSALGEAPPI